MSGRRAACCARPRRTTACRATRATTTSTKTTSGRRSSARRKSPAESSSASAAGDVRHDPLGGSCPTWCRAGADVPGEESSDGGDGRAPAHSGAGRRDRARPGSSSSPPVPARARRRCSSSASSVRSTPASTSARSSSSPTPTAPPPSCAARIRTRLAELGRPELTRELDGAWISTIHGFCTRLLRQYPFAAGLDPRFRVLDESQAAVLRVEAFDEALTEFCSGSEPERLALLATYGSQALRRMLTGVHETLRAAGRTLELSLGDAPGLDLGPLRAAASRARAENAARLVELLDRNPPPESLLDLSEYAVKGDDELRAGAGAVEQAALNAVAARDRELLQELLLGFERSLPGGEGPRVGARLRRSPAPGPRPAPRRRSDPRARAAALPPGLRRRVPGHEPAPVRADRPRRPRRALLRRRRVPVDLPLPARRRRGLQGAPRPDRRGAAADAQLALAAGDARGRQPPVRGDVRRRVPAARRRGPLPRPGVRPGGRAPRHRQGELQGRGARGAAARRRRSRGG